MSKEKRGHRNDDSSSPAYREVPQEMQMRSPLQSISPHSPLYRYPPPQQHPQPQLPVEILVLIFTHVTRTSDLLRVVQCSRTFRAVAEPLLYAHVNVKATPRRAYLLNKTLRGRGDLVGSIRKLALDARASVDANLPPDLEINLNQNNDAPPSPFSSSSTSLHLRFSGLEAPVLSDARNLQALDISFNPQPRVDPFHHQRSHSDSSIVGNGHPVAVTPEPTISLSQLISSHTRLTKLTIHFHLSPFFLHELVRSILRSQPNLKHLELWNVSFLPGLLETDVPNLETVVSGYPVAAQLTPTRPITTLAVHADHGQDTRALDFMPTWLQSPPPKASDAMDYDNLGQEHHLEDLFLKVQVTSPAQISLIQTISDRAPDLVRLKLAVTFVAASTFVSDSGWNMHLFNMFIGMIPNFLSRFRTLQVLDLCGSRGFVCRPTMMYNLGFNYSTGDPDLDAERSRVTGWSIHCPTLREVVLPNGHRWSMDKAAGEAFWTMAGGDHISERDEADENVQSRRFSKDLPWTS